MSKKKEIYPRYSINVRTSVGETHLPISSLSEVKITSFKSTAPFKGTRKAFKLVAVKSRKGGK